MTIPNNGVIVHATLQLGLKDCLRVLFGGAIHFSTAIKTERDPGKTEVGWEQIHVDPIFPVKPQQVGIENRPS